MTTALANQSVAVLNCWGVDPKTSDDGTFRRGGPELVGKLVEQIPARCDLVLRVDQEAMRKPWPAVYCCGFDRRYVMKDRLDIVTRISPAPMNLAEILRSAGMDLPFKYEWQAAVTTQMAQNIAAAAMPQAAANAGFQTLLQGGLDRFQAQWVIRDALDRVVISRALAASHLQFSL